MPGKNDLAPDHVPFEFRSGFNGHSWRGIVSEGDPSTTPPNALRMAVNARLVGGEVRERSGHQTLFTPALGGTGASVVDIVPYDPVRATKLWMIGSGCPGVDPALGFYLGSLDQEQDPELQAVSYNATEPDNLTIVAFGGKIYVAAGGSLKQFHAIRQPWGIDSLSISGVSQDSPVYTFTGFVIRCMMEFDGKLFIGLDNGAGASKIAVYDGVSVYDDKTAIDPPTCMARYRVQNGGDALMVGTSNANTIYYRPTGTGVAYTSIGTTTASYAMVAYKDILYIVPGDPGTDIYSWDGTTLGSAHAPASAVRIRGLAVFNNLLYFGYDTLAGSVIGKFTGSAWTDVHKNITAQLATARELRYLTTYRGFLIACGRRTPALLNRSVLWVSPGTTTNGTWTEIEVSDGALFYLVVI